MSVGIAEKVYKVRGQRSRSWSEWRRHAFRRCGVEAYLFFLLRSGALCLVVSSSSLY